MIRGILHSISSISLYDTVTSHGWVNLAPWKWDVNKNELSRPERLKTGNLVRVSVTQLDSKSFSTCIYIDKLDDNWSNDEILSKEFESVGFYLSNHPLKDYENILEQYQVKTFKEFENTNESQSFLAGTIMSLKEKKTIKGTSFAIIKFSDLSKVFELFLFSEILEKNIKNLIEGQSFLLTVIKDKENHENRFRRISVRKIVSLREIVKQGYSDVYIEINEPNNLKKLYEAIKEKGNSKIKISIKDKNKNYLFELKDKRKFDYETLKYLNKEHYIKKINL